MNIIDTIIVGSFRRIRFDHATLASWLASFFPSCFFSLTYFLAYLIRHIFTFRGGVSLARFLFRIAVFSVIITAGLFHYLDPAMLMGMKIGYYTNFLCTILVFLIGVPLSQAKIAHGLSQQVGGRHYNWFINLFRKKVAATLKSRIKAATIVDMDTVMDDMIGPLLIAIELLGAALGGLIPLLG